MRKATWLSINLFLNILIIPLFAQEIGIIAPDTPPVLQGQQAEINSVELNTTIKKQVAEVSYTVEFYNPTNRVIETEYLFPLPRQGTLQDVVLLADGKELPGRILSKDEARKIYENIVRSQRDPALIEYIDRGLYRAKVFPIPPEESRTVTLKTTYLCERDKGVIEFNFPLAPHGHGVARKIKNLEIITNIHTDKPLKSIYSPSHKTNTERINNTQARVTYEGENVNPKRDFRLFYHLEEGLIGGSVISHRPDGEKDGYFMMLASPEVKEKTDTKDEDRGKTVIFAIDRSGSMRGQKMKQARKAAKFVISNLNQKDLFNIIVYDSDIETYRPELERLTPETRKEALDYVANLRAGGMTDIDGAMKTSLNMLTPQGGPAYVLFLTDGRPTIGVQNEARIAKNAKDRNTAGANIFNFGIGYDVNARLLDRISSAHGGYTEYVGPDENVEASVARFYSRLTSPVMTDIELKVANTAVNRIYPENIPDIFEGGQIVLVGRYSGSGEATFTIEGKVSDKPDSMNIEARLAQSDGRRTGNYEFIERIWAQRRIGAILQQIDLHGREDELVEELVQLSKKYGILTPYTSFLADEDGERGAQMAEAVQQKTTTVLASLDTFSGRRGVEQRKQLGKYQRSTAVMAEDISVNISGEKRRVDTIRQVAGLTFFKRGDEWVQAELLDKNLNEAELEEVERYSDRFFKLASSARNGRSLAQTGVVIVRLNDEIYRIVETKEKQ